MFSSYAVASSRVATGSKSSYYAMKLAPLSSVSLLFALELNSEPSSEEMDEELERNDIANLYFHRQPKLAVWVLEYFIDSLNIINEQVEMKTQIKKLVNKTLLKFYLLLLDVS